MNAQLYGRLGRGEWTMVLGVGQLPYLHHLCAPLHHVWRLYAVAYIRNVANFIDFFDYLFIYID